MSWGMNPGSEEAVEKGCTCPVVDNHYGQGVDIYGDIQFWVNGNCPIHGTGAVCASCGGDQKQYPDETGESFGI